MIRITLIAFLCAVFHTAFSQTSFSANSDTADFYFKKGLEQKNGGSRLESMKYFEKAAKYDEQNKEILNELALAYYDLRKYYQAIEQYKKLVELGDPSAQTYKQLLTLSFNYKKYDDVILYAGKLKEADPSEKINYYLGKVYYEQEDYGNAIRYLESASKDDPQNAETPYMIARSYGDMMNYKQCISYYKKAIELDTTKYYWVYELGLMYYAINDNKNSLKYIVMAGEKGYRKDNDYMENLAIAYLNVGQPDEAITILNDLLKKKPSDINILGMLAETHYDKKKYQEAIDYWDQVLFYDKNNASALYMIGMSYQKKGEKQKGIQLCDKAIEMDPSLSSLKQKRMVEGL